MNVDELIKISADGASAEMIGRGFFASGYSRKDKAKFIKSMLILGKYGFIADVMGCGAINKQYNDVDFQTKQIGLVSLDQRYFDMFLEICAQGELTFEDISPLLFASFSAPQQSRLKSWTPAVEKYLVRKAKADYDEVLEALELHDKSYKRYGVLLAADRERTVSVLTNRLIYEKNTNKAAIRKFLFENKINIVPVLRTVYYGAVSDARVRESVVRQLLVSKNDAAAAEMLEYVALNDRSKTIRELIAKDADDKKKVGKSAEKIEKAAKKASGRKKFGEAEKTFFADMISGREYTPEQFRGMLSDPSVESVASGLLFSVHTGSGGIADIIIVEKGQVLNLDNDPAEIPDDRSIRVLHIAELPDKYEFLTRLNVTQPFLQLKRKAYIPHASELTDNKSRRISGTIIMSKELRQNISKEGFKIKGKDPDGKSAYAGIVLGGFICLAEFTRTDLNSNDIIVSFGDIKFYRYKDAIKLGGGFYFENVPVCRISEVPLRVFSEGIYAVCRLSGTLNER